MGTHPSGPAMLAAATDTCLQDWLESHPEALGAAVRARFGVKLPFLFKVHFTFDQCPLDLTAESLVQHL